MLHPTLSIREDIRQRFLREGYAANSIKHEGAVLVVDDDVTDDGAAFLVMELVRGSDVEGLWARANCRLTAQAVLAIAHQVLDVLGAAHAKNVIHRDIKPANLFVTNNGTVKVLDFGIARARDLAIHAGNATGTGLVLGTPAFMAPEQAMGSSSEIGPQTDLYAVGATMFALVSGKMVYLGDNSQQVMIRTATTPARSLRTVGDFPAPLVELVDKALAFERGGRWATAAQMRTAVEGLFVQLFGHTPGPSDLAPLVGQTGSGSAAVTARTHGAALAPTERESMRLAEEAQGTPSRTLAQAPSAELDARRPAGTFPSGSHAVTEDPTGLSTAHPVSNEVPTGGRIPKTKERGVRVAVGLAGVGVLAVGLWLGLGRSTLATVPPAPASPATTSSAPVPARRRPRRALQSRPPRPAPAPLRAHRARVKRATRTPRPRPRRRPERVGRPRRRKEGPRHEALLRRARRPPRRSATTRSGRMKRVRRT